MSPMRHLRISSVSESRAIGYEAGHIQWHAYNGFDGIEIGLALCSLYHKLFDIGHFQEYFPQEGSACIGSARQASQADFFCTQKLSWLWSAIQTFSHQRSKASLAVFQFFLRMGFFTEVLPFEGSPEK
jgi:hypothetical protein